MIKVWDVILRDCSEPDHAWCIVRLDDATDAVYMCWPNMSLENEYPEQVHRS